MDATQPHDKGRSAAGQRRNTYSALSPTQPVMPEMVASVGLRHVESLSVPPGSIPDKSILYRSEPAGAAKMVARLPPGHAEAADQAETGGRGTNAGKAPLAP